MDLLGALSDLALAFGGKAGADRLAVYAERLSDIEEELVVAAIERIMLTRSDAWMPTIGEIRREVAGGGGDVTGGAEVAWTEVIAEMRRVGSGTMRVFTGGKWYDPEQPRFTSPVTEAAVRSLTWRLICTGEQAEMREQFIWTWRHLAERMLKAGAKGETDMALGSGQNPAMLGQGQ